MLFQENNGQEKKPRVKRDSELRLISTQKVFFLDIMLDFISEGEKKMVNLSQSNLFYLRMNFLYCP